MKAAIFPICKVRFWTSSAASLLFLLLLSSNGVWAQDLDLNLDDLLPEVIELGEGTYFDLSAYNTFPYITLETVGDAAKGVWQTVSRRLGVSVDMNIQIVIKKPQRTPCPLRGLASPISGEITLYLDQSVSAEQVLALLAHEFAHVLVYQGLGVATSDFGLSEGLATWAAGDYWSGWQKSSSLDTSVKRYLKNGNFLTISKNIDFSGAYEPTAAINCVVRRDILYTEWASFIGYLLETYGRKRLLQLIKTSPTVEKPRAPNYLGVYGYSLEQLENAWLQRVELGL